MSTDQKGTKRKHKRSFIQTVKKKFKNMSHRSKQSDHLEEDIHEYFLRVFEQSRQQFADDNEKRIFVDNVLTETVGNEVKYSRNQLVSRVIEDLLPFSNEKVLERYMAAFYEDGVREIALHQFNSHVLEALLCLAARHALDPVPEHTDATEDYEEHRTKCCEFILKVSRILLNNLEEVVTNTFASHVLRTAVACLANTVPDRKDRGQKTKNHDLCSGSNSPSAIGGGTINEDHPPEFVSILQELARKVLCFPNFADFPYDLLMSTVLQSILTSLHTVKSKKEIKLLVQHLLDVVYSPTGATDSDTVEGVLDVQESVRLMETMLQTSTSKLYTKIYLRCFAGRLAKLALGKTSTFAVQKLIQRCDNTSEFEAIYNELSRADCFGDMVTGSNIAGVLLALSRACRRLDTKQSTFVKDLESALGVQGADDKHLVLQLLKMRPLADSRKPNEGDDKSVVINDVNLHGCLIVQELMMFTKHAKVVKSFLDVDSADLAAILSHQRGSHIKNTFFAKDRSEKSVERFLEKIKDSLVALATSKHGAFTITSLWEYATVAQKLVVIKALCEQESLVLSTPSGRVIARQVGIDTYRHQPKEWETAQARLKSTKKLFEDIISKKAGDADKARV